MSRRDHSNKTREVAARLARDGWIVVRKGPAITSNIGIPPSPAA
jgi:hypothetical protein